jgi:hypothetical protein
MYFSSSEEQKRYICYKCNEELIFEVKVGRRDMCPNCSAYLHSCFNCHHWDIDAHNQCRENQGEFIRDRAEGNFCGYFEFRTVGEVDTSEADAAKTKLNNLFGDSKLPSKKKLPEGFAPSPRTEADALSRLDDLFKK